MEFFFVLVILLAAARGLGEVAEWVGLPALVGELMAGVSIGLAIKVFPESLSFLNGIEKKEAFIAITDLGVFFLMLLGGVELQASRLMKASRSAIWVAFWGMILPLAAGYGAGHALFPDSPYKVAQCLFVGTALAITAVPVSIRVLMDLGKLETKVGRLIVSSAVIDDVLSLVILAVLTGMIANGAVPDFGEMGMLVVNVFVFFLIAGLVGKFVFPRFKFIQRLKSVEFEFTCLLVAALGLAVLAEVMNLHFIIGAFLAGLFFGRQDTGKKVYEGIKARLSGLTNGFLAPIFFVAIGLHLDLSAMVAVPGFVVLLTAIAILTKLVGAGLPARLQGCSWRDSFAVGIGMSGRGAVELIIAGIALKAGLFDQPAAPEIAYLFSTVVIVAIVTTIFAPIGLRLLYRAGPAKARALQRHAGTNV